MTAAEAGVVAMAATSSDVHTKASSHVAALLHPSRPWVRWSPTVASLWASVAIVATLANAAGSGRRCMNVSPSANISPADVFYPALMCATAVNYAFAGACLDRWLRLGLAHDVEHPFARLLRLLTLPCWLVCSVFVALVALFPLSEDETTQRVHSTSADLLVVIPIIFISSYLLLWICSDALRRTLSPRHMLFKWGITVAVPVAVVGLSFAVLGYPCDGVRQWAQYFTFIAFFGSFSVELSLAWPPHHPAAFAPAVASDAPGRAPAGATVVVHEP